MALEGVSRRCAQECQALSCPVCQPLKDSRQGKRFETHGSQFDRQWQTIQTSANLSYGCRIVFGDLKSRINGLSAFDEEADGGKLRGIARITRLIGRADFE